MTKKFQVPVRGKTKITAFYDAYINVEANSAKEAIDKAIGMDLEQRRARLSTEQDDFNFEFSTEDIYEMEKEAFTNADESTKVDVIEGIDEDEVVEVD